MIYNSFFDLLADPGKGANRAGDRAAAVLARMRAMVEARRDLAVHDPELRDSRSRRPAAWPVLRNGAVCPWDFRPLQRAAERDMRNHMGPNLPEAQRFPRGS